MLNKMFVRRLGTVSFIIKSVVQRDILTKQNLEIWMYQITCLYRIVEISHLENLEYILYQFLLARPPFVPSCPIIHPLLAILYPGYPASLQ